MSSDIINVSIIETLEPVVITVETTEIIDNISVTVSELGGKGDDGDSAYQVWLDEGNIGTEADFILSLKGETGPAPVKGVDYFDGLPNILTVGTVETIPTSQPAEVTITGTSPAQVINLKLPKGETGAAGANSWGDIGGTLSNQTDLNLALESKEPVITKNTAFNKNFGTNGDTVTQGNDSRLSDKRDPTTHGNLAHTEEYATKTSLDALKVSLDRISSTGLVSGGDLAITPDNLRFNVQSGLGTIVDNFTNPDVPIKVIVSWGDINDIESPYLSTESTTYISIKLPNTIVNGFAIATISDIVLETEEATPEDRRDRIYIGWADHADNLTISDAKVQPFSVTGIASQLIDFMVAFGPFNITGNIYGPLINLQCIRSAGSTFDSNANYTYNKKNPHILETNREEPVELVYYFQDGAGDWVNDGDYVGSIDPNHWDDGSGTLAEVPTGKWTIQLIAFYAQTLANDFQYGQVVYDDYASAKSALQNPVLINPYNSYDTFRGWVIIQEGTTELTDLNFTAAGKLGLIDVSSGGGTGGEINTASNSAVGTGTGLIFKNKVGVDLVLRKIKSGSSKLTILNDTDDIVLDVAVSKSDVGLGNVTNFDTTNPSNITQDSTHRFSTDIEKSAWDSKVTSVDGRTSTVTLSDLYASIAHVGTGGNSHANVIAAGASGFITGSDKTKLDSVESGANNYTHPVNHAPSIITQDISNRFVTDAEKSTWSGKQDALGFTAVPNTRTVAGHALTSDVVVSKSDVGLSAVTNDAQVKKIASSTSGNLMVWSGTTGDTPSDSTIVASTVATAVSSAHTHTNKANLDLIDQGLASTSTPTFASITDSGLTASQIVQTNSGKTLVSVAPATAYNQAFETSTSNIKMDGSVSVGALSTIARSDHTHPTDTSREASIGTKNTAFNKNYETSTSNIKMNGSVSVGSVDSIARGDHVHATDTSREPANANIQTHISSTSNPHGTSDANLSTTDITTNNVSTTKHGFVPKATNIGNYLKDDGTWAPVTGGSGEVNTASNLGTGTGIFNSKVVADLQFKSLKVAGTGISISDDTTSITLTGSGGGTGGQKYTFVLHVGENATVGNNKTNILIVPVIGTIQEVSAVAKIGPVGSALIFDINKNGSTIWATQGNRVQIASGSTFGSQTVFDTTSLAKNDLLTIDIDQVGSSIAGQEITIVVWTI